MPMPDAVSAEMMIAATIRQRLKQRRKETRRSLQQVAAAAGITKNHVWDIETGAATNPSIKTIVGLARGLGVSVSWLMGLTHGAPALSPGALRIALDIDAMVREAARPKAPASPEPRREIERREP